MSLQIFANNERTTNSTRFYRLTSATPYSVVFRVEDTGVLTDLQFINKYSSIEYSFNWGTKQLFAPNNPYIGIPSTFNRSLPCVSSFQVYLSSAITGVSPETLSISAIFLGSFPNASTFVAYPSSYVVESQPPVQMLLNSSNYTVSPGLSFYGEGHTENILLSAKLPDSSHKANWFIGNSINELNNLLRISKRGVLTTTTPSFSTAVVRLSSSPSEHTSIPLSLFVTNSDIDLADSPIITYPDAGGGGSQFYDYFYSSRNIDETLNSSNSNLKNDIQVMPYPIPDPTYGYASPFPLSKTFNLPLNYTNRTFKSIVYPLPYTSFLSTYYKGSLWELEARSSAGSWVYPTGLLPQITAYQFRLGYDNTGGALPFFKTSALYNTTIFVNVSTTERFLLSTAQSSDWMPRTVTRSVMSDPAVVYALPFVKIFTPNYYNLKNAPVNLTNVTSVFDPGLTVNKIEIFSDSLSGSAILSGSNVYGTASVQFIKSGLVDLSATVTFTTVNNSITKEITINFPDFIEVVEKYDDIEPLYYHVKSTELQLTTRQAPLLSPNEWVTADNVNSIIRKLYTTIQELIYRSFYYRPRYKFYGWLGSSKMINEVVPIDRENILYTWQDLKCSIPGTTTKGTAVSAESSWIQQDCSRVRANPPAYDIRWIDQKCSVKSCDPSCFQKYCTEWNWSARKRINSKITTTWNNTKRNQRFQKAWKYEKCELDSDPVACDDKGKWHLSNIDPEWFPIPSCVSKRRIFYKGIAVMPDEKIVVAHEQEINLLANDYPATLLGRRGIADDLYSFQQIENIAVNSIGHVYVLDGKIPRVTIYEIKNDKFKLYSFWGSFGFINNPNGFNKPKDIHIDGSDYVWITDTGNGCIKKYTAIGNHILTIAPTVFESNIPLSVCVDSSSKVHILTQNRVYVCTSDGVLDFYYDLPITVTKPSKINTSFNREAIYITFETGIAKFFDNGNFSHFLVFEGTCGDNKIISNYTSIVQDKYRNLLVIEEDKIFKYGDLMELVEAKSPLNMSIFWDLQRLLVNREEYIQPWVYLKSFHRLWDNIEILRSSMFYDVSGCRSFVSPKNLKSDLIIGQNEIVVNSVINRISTQLWENIESMFNYFDPTCIPKGTKPLSLNLITNPITVVAHYKPGSIVVDYVATTTYPVDKPVLIKISNTLMLQSSSVVVNPIIQINQGRMTGNATKTINAPYSTLTQSCSFDKPVVSFVGRSTKFKYPVTFDCVYDAITTPTPTPTPTRTPTPTPTRTPTPTPTRTPTPTPTPTVTSIPGWRQRGVDIDGEASNDNSGFCVSLNDLGDIVAIGAPYNDGINGADSGHVRIYKWNGTSWNQQGADIDGEAPGDHSGFSVSVNGSGDTVAIGAPHNDGNGLNSGHVRIYKWNGTSWNQLGTDINGEAVDDYFGFSVSLNNAGDKIAIGAINNATNGNDSGHTKIYQFSGGSWNQMGVNINGDAASDQSGYSVSLNDAGNTVAIGAIGNDVGGNNSGHVKIYYWSGSAWIQRGSNINGSAAGDRSGCSVSLNGNGTLVAIGSYLSNINGTDSGNTKVFVWSGIAWIQRGSDLSGQPGDKSGTSVSLNTAGDIIAIGAPFSDSNGLDSGSMKLYEFNGTSWIQKGLELTGESTDTGSGCSVSLNSNGRIIAVGAQNNNGINGIKSGHTRIYEW